MSTLPNNISTATFRSATFPRIVHHSDSLPVHSPKHHRPFRRRSVSEGAKKRIKQRNNKIVPVQEDVAENATGHYVSSNRAAQEDTAMRLSHTASSNGQHDHDGNNNRWKWLVTDDMLESLPKYYPLEKTTIVLHNLPVSILSGRVSEFLRINSIASRYHATRVFCTTPKLCRFSVNLWKDQKNSGGVIVELQRHDGCCIEMQWIRSALFHAITTGEMQQVYPRRRCISVSLMQEFEQMHESNDTTATHDSLAIALKLLQSDYLDQQRLGMESLKVLVNPAIVCQECAVTVSRGLVYGKDNTILRDAVISFLDNTKRPAYETEDDEEDGFSQSHWGDMHHLALQVMVHAFEVAAMNHHTGLRLDTYSSFYEIALEAMAFDLTVAHQHPQEACLSARALVLLMQLEPGQRLQNLLLVSGLMDAHEYGQLHHVQLETETHRLLEMLMH